MSRSSLTAGLLARLAPAALALLVSACATGGAAFVPPSRPAEFSLAGVPWNIRPDSVTALIEPRGYNFNRVDEDGDMWFDGVLLRSPTRLYAFIAEEKLVKFRVFINTADEDAMATYQEARAELVKQYGQPKATTEEYKAPYKKGDGKEQEAVRAKKATIETYWLPGASSRMSYVAIRVNADLTVTIDYEGPAWERESVRRRTAGR